MSKDSMSQRKAAAYLGIAPATLGSYVRAGIAPPYIDFYGVRRFDVASLEIWLRARRGGAAQ